MPYRNRPDRRRIEVTPQYQARALIRPTVAVSGDTLTFTFPATYELVDDSLETEECCVDPGQAAQSPASVTSTSPTELVIVLPFQIEANGGVFWFPFNNESVVITDGRVLDPTPYVVEAP